MMIPDSGLLFWGHPVYSWKHAQALGVEIETPNA